jgi:hypothetical protein
MSWKRLVLCVVAVFVTQALVNSALFGLVMDRVFNDPALQRAEGEEQLAIYMASRVLSVGLLVYIFAFWYGRRGWQAGLHYGIVIWLFYTVPMTIGFWSFLRMSNGLALAWIAIGLVEYVTSGLVLGLLCGHRVAGLAVQRAP